jgi:hypothetical protein
MGFIANFKAKRAAKRAKAAYELELYEWNRENEVLNQALEIFQDASSGEEPDDQSLTQKKGELVLWTGQGTYHVAGRTPSTYSGGSQGFSIPLVAGIPTSELLSIQELIDAQNCDLFDVLEFVKYALKPVTRKARATVSRSILEAGIEAKQMEFIDFLVSQYIESGVGELEESKLETLLEIKYADVFSAVKVLGNGEVAKVRDLFLNFQKNLYLPHKEYQNVS